MISYSAAWDASASLGIKPVSVYHEMRHYEELAREALLPVCEAMADELTGWLNAQSRLGHDLVDAYRTLHFEPPRSRRLAMLASNLIPFSVYLLYLNERRGDPHLAAMWTRTKTRQPVHVRRVENAKVAAEELFWAVTSRAGFTAWLKAVEESPVRARPGWGSPIKISFSDETKRGAMILGDDRRTPDVDVHIALTATVDGTRLELLAEERLIESDVRPERRKAQLVGWWREVVLPELLHLVDDRPRDSRAPRFSGSHPIASRAAWPTLVRADNSNAAFRSPAGRTGAPHIPGSAKR